MLCCRSLYFFPQVIHSSVGTVREDMPHSFGVAGVYGFVGGHRSQKVLEGCDVIVGFCMSDLSKAGT
jgi:hypothetical protein